MRPSPSRSDRHHCDLRMARGELVALADGAVLYEPVIGCVAFVNASAADVWRDLAAAPSLDEGLAALARRWQTDRTTVLRLVEPLLEAWNNAGLLTMPSAEPPPTPRIASVACPWRATYSVGERSVELRTSDRTCGDILDRVLAPLRTHKAPEAAITLEGDGARYAVRTATRGFEDLDFASARHVALRELIRAARSDDETTAVFHAGAVALQDRAVVFAGESGSGKTTLIADLVATGFTYVGDDLLGLDATGAAVWPFPVALSIKPQSAPGVVEAIAERSDLTLSAADEFGLSYLRVGNAPPATEAVPVAALYFPTFDATCREAHVTRLSPVEALTELLHSGTRVVGEAPSIAPLAHFVERVPAVRVRYADMRAVARHVRERLAA